MSADDLQVADKPRTSRSAHPASGALYLGMDLGCFKTSIAATNGTRETVYSIVGWPKDPVSRKMLGKDIVFGNEAFQHRLALDVIRPFEKGALKYADNTAAGVAPERLAKFKEAARELVKHCVSLTRPPVGTLIYGVIGAPAEASVLNKQALMDACKGVFEAVMIVSEPFAVAYGMNALEDCLVVDIGAGTTDLCRMHGAIPTKEDQVTSGKAGDSIDAMAVELIKKAHPTAQFTINMVREAKERLSFVNDVNDKAIVTWPNDQGHRAGHRAGPPQARLQLRRRVPEAHAAERRARRRRQPDPRPGPDDRGGAAAVRRRPGHQGPRARVRRRQRRPQAGPGHAGRVLERSQMTRERPSSPAGPAEGAALVAALLLGTVLMLRQARGDEGLSINTLLAALAGGFVGFALTRWASGAPEGPLSPDVDPDRLHERDVLSRHLGIPAVSEVRGVQCAARFYPDCTQVPAYGVLAVLVQNAYNHPRVVRLRVRGGPAPLEAVPALPLNSQEAGVLRIPMLLPGGLAARRHGFAVELTVTVPEEEGRRCLPPKAERPVDAYVDITGIHDGPAANLTVVEWAGFVSLLTQGQYAPDLEPVRQLEGLQGVASPDR
jgi:hypothetical protein